MNPFGPTGALPGDTGIDAGTADGTADGTSAETSDGAATSSADTSAGSDTGPLVPVTILNGSFELTSFEPGCYHNLTNEEFNMAVEHVTAFGLQQQIDVYDDCFGVTPDGVFHVGLVGARGTSDAIAMSLSGPLNLGYGHGYRLRFFADYGTVTGAGSSTNVQIGVSSDPSQFGVLVGETGLLNDDSTEYEMVIMDEGSTYLTVQVEPDRDIGWAMVDAFRLEPIP